MLAFPLAAMLRLHCLQIWWNLSDEQAEEEMYDSISSCAFVGLDGESGMPDAVAILRFRHLLDAYGLAHKIFAIVNKRLEEAPQNLPA